MEIQTGNKNKAKKLKKVIVLPNEFLNENKYKISFVFTPSQFDLVSLLTDFY